MNTGLFTEGKVNWRNQSENVKGRGREREEGGAREREE